LETITMKAIALLGTALVAAAAHAGLLPARDASAAAEDDFTESKALADLLNTAKTQVLEKLKENEKSLRDRGETPPCTADKLVFRRE
jgi:tyrosinase